MSQTTWTAERQRPYQYDRPGAGMSRSSTRTYDELYDEAKRRNIKGRSKMSKTELERALGGR